MTEDLAMTPSKHVQAGGIITAVVDINLSPSVGQACPEEGVVEDELVIHEKKVSSYLAASHAMTG